MSQRAEIPIDVFDEQLDAQCNGQLDGQLDGQFSKQLNEQLDTLGNSAKPKEISRKEFLLLSSAVAVLGSLGALRFYDIITMGARKEALWYLDDDSEEMNRFRFQVQELIHVYGLQVHTDIAALNRPLESIIIPPNHADILRGVDLLHKAVQAYPSDFFRRNTIRGAAIVNSYHNGGIKYTGFAPHFADYFVFASGAQYPDDQATISTIHHEIYHKIDLGSGSLNYILNFVFNRGLSNSRNDWIEIYQQCPCQADPEYLYNSGFAMGWVNQIEQFPPGKLDTVFASSYARTNDLEDRAVTAQHLMSPRLHRRLLVDIALLPEAWKLAIWHEKIEYIKRQYYEASGGLMNEEYWRLLAAGQQPFFE